IAQIFSSAQGITLPAGHLCCHSCHYIHLPGSHSLQISLFCSDKKTPAGLTGVNRLIILPEDWLLEKRKILTFYWHFQATTEPRESDCFSAPVLDRRRLVQNRLRPLPGRVVMGTQHGRQLLNTPAIVQPPDSRHRAPIVNPFAHVEVAVTVARQLWQMGHDNHLVLALCRQSPQLATHDVTHAPANAL